MSTILPDLLNSLNASESTTLRGSTRNPPLLPAFRYLSLRTSLHSASVLGRGLGLVSLFDMVTPSGAAIRLRPLFLFGVPFVEKSL
jgi:hypothetical protein